MSVIHIHPREQLLWMKTNARKTNTSGDNHKYSVRERTAKEALGGVVFVSESGCSSLSRAGSRKFAPSDLEGMGVRNVLERASELAQVAVQPRAVRQL